MISLSCTPDVYEKSSELLKAIDHPNRLQIIDRLHKDDSINVTSLYKQLKLPQSTVSQHLARLKSASVITGIRNGNEVTYKLANADIKNAFLLLIKSHNSNI
jgi:DNA-binding transcriptional ArsR family regulator